MAAPKRKRSSIEAARKTITNGNEPPLKRRASARNATTSAIVNPNLSGEVIDAPDATRASPDSDVNEQIVPGPIKREAAESPLSDAPAVIEPPKKKGRGQKAAVEKDGETVVKNGRAKQKVKQEVDESTDKRPAVKKEKKAGDEIADPEAEGDEEADEEEVKDALSRPPPVHSDYLPLPWKGRLGYACLNTYLRNSNPPIFSSRTCRIQSILEHRHPLQDPTQPEHATRNRPDRTKPANIELGKRYVEQLCLANVADVEKMLRWNNKYNIKFLRLSSEMFPFASHPEYGYKLAPFAADALAAAGRVVAELGHRVTTHPGQFTQLGSPRQQVIDNSIRDLAYHDEMLSLLQLPEQQNKDAVMILHMGGIFEGKAETLQRFRENYTTKLSQSVKNRLVLENDDMGWSVHDLLPICEELNIPMVLDYHHHNIVFDASQIREGTHDIQSLYPRIKATWDRKGITQKMHYSEPTPAAITPRQRRKHNPRVATLPPCALDMDLMIEAKDKEQAVFELMRTFRLPGYENFNDIIPHVRTDDNKAVLAAQTRKKKKTEDPEPEPELVPDEEVGMGGPEGRVYWPPGMEEWLRPKKREIKKKDPEAEAAKKEKAKKAVLDAYNERQTAKARGEDGEQGQVEVEVESDVDATPATKKAKAAMRKKQVKVEEVKSEIAAATSTAVAKKAGIGKGRARGKKMKGLPSPSEEEDVDPMGIPDFEGEEEDEEPVTPAGKRKMATRKAMARQGGGRRAKTSGVNYAEVEENEE